MKIVYTNLQEDDFGGRRSVKHLQVDFNRKPSGRETPIAEERLQNEAGGSKGRRLSDGSFSARKQTVSRSDRPERERRRGDTVEDLINDETSRACLVEIAGSSAGFYIRRFIETQLRTTRRVESGNRINIFV